MNDYKKLFHDVIEKDEIEDEGIVEFAHYCADRVPEYFWTIPASSSGKYHPITDLGEGGLVRHSLMVYRVAVDLLNATTDERLLAAKDEILFACLFHDCCKNGFANSGHTEHEHPILATEFLSVCYTGFVKQYPEYSYISIDDINTMIESHMGKWNTSKYSETNLPIPVFSDEKFVHECDYIASRKYCLFDEDYFNQFI